VTSVPGFVPPTCSDLFDAIDSSPVDGASRGGDGKLDNLDLIVTLRRVTGADTSRPRRASRGLVCSVGIPRGLAPMAARPQDAAGGMLEFGPPEAGRVPVYLRAVSALKLSALSFSAGVAQRRLRFVAGEAGPPSLVDQALEGLVAVAWLDGFDLAAGGRLLLGYIETVDGGDAGPAAPAFHGAQGNDRETGRAIVVALPGARPASREQ
jgi:hypothetical protein